MEKRIIANELLPVYQDGEDKLVDGRELHGVLKVGRDFATWMKERIEKYGFTEGNDFILTLTKTGERQNVVRHDYVLKLDMAKELCMVENNEQGRQARKYFIEVEKRYRNGGHASPPDAATKPLTKIEQADRLLEILRTQGELLNDSTQKAIWTQLAETAVGFPIMWAHLDTPATPPFPPRDVATFFFNVEDKASEERPVKSPQGKGGYSATAIGFMAGCHRNTVGRMATKHGLRAPEYGEMCDYSNSRGNRHEIFLFNELGKETLLALLRPAIASMKG